MLDVSQVFAQFPVLKTKRVILRESTPDDAANVLRVMGNPQITNNLVRLPLADLAEARERITIYRNIFEEKTGFCWLVERESEVIGHAVLFRLSAAHHRAEVGYTLLPEWWGKGLATEIAAAVVRFGFIEVGLHSIEAHTNSDNTGSHHVLEKLGFVREGYFRENAFDPVTEKFIDSAVYSLLKSAWMNPNT